MITCKAAKWPEKEQCQNSSFHDSLAPGSLDSYTEAKRTTVHCDSPMPRLPLAKYLRLYNGLRMFPFEHRDPFATRLNIARDRRFLVVVWITKFLSSRNCSKSNRHRFLAELRRQSSRSSLLTVPVSPRNCPMSNSAQTESKSAQGIECSISTLSARRRALSVLFVHRDAAAAI